LLFAAVVDTAYGATMSHPLNRHTCEEAFRRLDDFLDRRLTPDETRLVEQHLQTCAACTHEFAFEASVLTNVRRKLRRLEAPADLLRRVLARLDPPRRPEP
jgi:anti-sigma factor (TIGR02949 family)